MKVSVVIPALNEEKNIGKCLESLKNQKEKPYEIIVVDNYSEDKTAQIAKSFGAKVIKEKKLGISYARNRGFNSAKGDIIARIDADTVAPSDWTIRIKKDLKDVNTVAVTGPANYLKLPSFIQISNIPVYYFLRFLKAYLKNNVIFGLNMAIKKPTWEKVKDELCMDNTKVHEDFDLAFHLWKYGKIKLDKKLIVTTSLRKWKSVYSDIEYTRRLIGMLRLHDLG